MNSPERPWFEIAFGARYDEVYAHRDDAAAEREVAWIERVLALAPGSVVLDVGCGNGRHLAAWSRRGHSAVGIDLSPELVGKARARALANTCVLRGDMRALGFGPYFDLTTNLFTSFGYFAPEDDERVLAGIAAATRRRGRLVLDYLNADAVRRSLVPRSTREQGGRTITETRSIDEELGRVEKEVWILERDGTETRYRESVRLYSVEDLETALRRVGFVIESRYGDLAGAPCTPDAPRVVIIARREDESS